MWLCTRVVEIEESLFQFQVRGRFFISKRNGVRCNLLGMHVHRKMRCYIKFLQSDVADAQLKVLNIQQGSCNTAPCR